jgi:hypothetical protein
MTAPYYGKREPGALTAASPGDTLYFNFGGYNDSGDSEAVSGFAVTDIEVFKNGDATARATDSGYSLISDTGQIGNRVGLNRFSVQLYNTADDTGFYDVGGWYQVAVDSVTVDGKTVRFWVGSFEIGRQRVNVREIVGDTGATSRLLKLAGTKVNDSGTFDTGTGILRGAAATVDTGAVNNAVWNGNVSAHVADTGSFGYAQGRLMAVRNDTGAAHLDQGRFGVISDSGRAAAVLDTGKVAAAVWTSHATRTLTAFALDTGIAQTVWREQNSAYTDTGSFGYGVNVHKIDNDTGAAAHVQQAFNVQSALADTGLITTQLAAIKTKTDSLTFTVANQVDANTQYVNDVQVQGTGDTGTANTWRPV